MAASALRPDRAGLGEAVLALRDTAEEVLLAAPTVDEVLYGMWRAAERDPRFIALANWWAGAVLGPAGLRVLVPDAAALVAGARVRARRRLPPTGGRRGDGESKQDRRASWRADIQIAVIAWRQGLPLATANVRDFAVVADVLAELYPGQPRLTLVGPPTALPR